jgi:hypothetical protein
VWDLLLGGEPDVPGQQFLDAVDRVVGDHGHHATLTKMVRSSLYYPSRSAELPSIT